MLELEPSRADISRIEEERLSDMTNDPRYSPPPQQPGYRSAPNQPVAPAYAQGHQQPYNQPFDWRYQQGQQSQPSQTTQYRRPYEPFGDTGSGSIPGGTGP